LIDAALNQLATQLNQYCRNRFSLSEDVCVVSNLVDAAGGAVPLVENKLVLFLGGVERDTVAHRAVSHAGASLDRLAVRDPVFLNLLVVCAANFSGKAYASALRFLSSAIAFFQGKPVFDHANTPELDAGIERLILNIENLNITDTQNLWSLNGGHYLPSVIYRVSMLTLDSTTVVRREHPVHEVQVGA